MNDSFRFRPRTFSGEASISSYTTDDKDSRIIISIRDAFLDPKTLSAATTRLLMADKDAQILMLINSVGGNVYALRQILAAMEVCEAKITTHVTGIAASCGAMLWLYGDELTMSPLARVMFHGSSMMGITGNTVQLAETLEKQVEVLNNMLHPAITKNILTEEEYDNMVNGKSDIYLTYQELKAKGVVA
jgi:ATP-dependent protease ClpP protease subunit